MWLVYYANEFDPLGQFDQLYPERKPHFSFHILFPDLVQWDWSILDFYVYQLLYIYILLAICIFKHLSVLLVISESDSKSDFRIRDKFPPEEYRGTTCSWKLLSILCGLCAFSTPPKTNKPLPFAFELDRPEVGSSRKMCKLLS